MPRKQPALLHLGLAASLAFASISAGCGGSTTSVDANTALTGTYGGASTDTSRVPATLQLTGSGGELALPCDSSYRFTQPLVTDSSGHFSVPGTEDPSGIAIPVSGPRVIPVTLSGTAIGDTITINVTNNTSQTSEGTYTVVRGKDAPAFGGGCVA